MYPKSLIWLTITLLISVLGVHQALASSNSTDITGAINYTGITHSNFGIYGIPLNASNLIGVQLSKTCITLELHHIKSNCPTYDKIKFIDNTIPGFSGVWINQTGYYHRVISHVSNVYISNPNKFVVMIDPDPFFTLRAKMIIIQSNNFTHMNPDENATNTRLIQHVNRFITAPCEGATVAPIISLIVDTVKYLESNCKVTNFNDTQIIQRTEIPFSFDNQFSSLHYLQYLKSIYHSGYLSVNETGGHGLKDCITHKCNYKDPYSKW